MSGIPSDERRGTMNDPKKPTDPEAGTTTTTEAADGEIADQDLKEIAGGIRVRAGVEPKPEGSFTNGDFSKSSTL